MRMHDGVPVVFVEPIDHRAGGSVRELLLSGTNSASAWYSGSVSLWVTNMGRDSSLG